jgi:recombination protein RecT
MTGQTVARAAAEANERPTLVQVVQRMQPEIARALPKGMDADRIARLALTVIRQSEMAKIKAEARGQKTSSLADCTAESFAGALLTACALGLEPGVDGEAYLVPYGNECTFIAGYKGYSKLFFQHPLARHLDAQAVYERDLFDYEKGLDPYLRHKPAKGDRGPVEAFYAVASLTTGARFFEVLTVVEVAAIRGASGRRKSNIEDPQQWMSRKTALRQLFHLVPKSTALSAAIIADEQTGTELIAQKMPEAILAAVPDDVDPATGEVDSETYAPAPDPNATDTEWPPTAEVPK